MPYHTLAYNIAAAGVNASNSDMSLVADTIISGRNSHAVFTDDFRMGMVALVGANVTRARFQSPTWNALGEWTIFNANRALTPPTNPQWDMYMDSLPAIPKEEEFQIQVSNNLGASTEQENAILQLLPSNWSANLKQGVQPSPFIARASFTLTPTINVWSGAQTLTFSQSLRGGLYAVLGCAVQGANAVAYRLIFPRAPTYGNRILRPGGLVQTAVGDFLTNQWDPWMTALGTMGIFHTFEPVQIELLGATAGSITYQVFMKLAYLGSGTDPNSAYGSV